ncbi:MAG TPA: transglycosylase domain-containing protein, partial [Allocoleopsis sp.]
MANLVTTLTNIIDAFSPKNVNSRSHSHLYNLKEQLADEVEIESYSYNNKFTEYIEVELENKKENVVTVKRKKAKPIYLRFWFWLITGLGSGSIVAGLVWYNVEKSLPDLSQIMNYARANTVTIKAGDGTIIQQLGENNYETVKINQVPKTLINAFIVAEDKSFYKHNGVDFQEILNTGLNRLQLKKNVEGSSTINQQLGRLIFTDKKGNNILRPLREIRIAQ